MSVPTQITMLTAQSFCSHSVPVRCRLSFSVGEPKADAGSLTLLFSLVQENRILMGQSLSTAKTNMRCNPFHVGANPRHKLALICATRLELLGPMTCILSSSSRVFSCQLCSTQSIVTIRGRRLNLRNHIRQCTIERTLRISTRILSASAP